MMNHRSFGEAPKAFAFPGEDWEVDQVSGAIKCNGAVIAPGVKAKFMHVVVVEGGEMIAYNAWPLDITHESYSIAATVPGQEFAGIRKFVIEAGAAQLIFL